MSKRSDYRKPRAADSRRRVNTLELRQSFLIVCEGAKTEPNYFKKFRVQKLVVVGTGHNTSSLVKKTVDLREKDRKDEKEYDQVWCVFDRDSFEARSFNEAFSLARKEGIHVAYSNEAFELWYFLHFAYHESAIARSLYTDKLTESLGVQYKKNSEDMYDRILDKQTTAIQNADRLLGRYHPRRPEKDNPSTTVHLLVKELLKNSA